MDQTSNPAPADHAFDPQNLCRYFSERSPQPKLALEGSTHIVRYANEAFIQLSHMKRSELIGHPFCHAVQEGEDNSCGSLLDRVYRSGISECLSEQKHGNAPPDFYWSYAAWPIQNGHEQPVGVMVQVTDASEIAVFRVQAATMNQALLRSSIRQHELVETTEELNTRLQAALKDKEYFIAVLSHELRTPLAPVLIAATMLLQDQRLSSDTRSIIDMIHRNITMEAHLIDDLLDNSRMEYGKMNLNRTTIDLRGVLERAVGLCAGDIETARLNVEVESENAPQIIQADDQRLLQVFSNLIRNAVKFTPAGGNILIRSRYGVGACVVEVIDSGIGIEPEFLPRVFSAFEQREKPHTRTGGLGLGLAICKMIVELHGGSITAKSAGKDRGTSFTVQLPTPGGVISTQVQEASPVPDRPVESKPLRILLVEDHVDTARIMARVLKSDGHSVQLAGTVTEALTLAAGHEFDLLVSDVGLPDGNGWDLMHALRQWGSKLPGIVLSGYGQDQDVERSYQAGFTRHLTKPLSLDKLRDAIGSLGG